MAKQRVPLWSNLRSYTVVDPDATDGATLGVNLRRRDGSLVTEDDLKPAASSDPSKVAKTLWSLVFDIPKNVTALAKAAGSGLFAIKADGSGVFRSIEGSPRIDVAHGDGEDGNPTIDLAEVPDAGGGVLQRTAFDSFGRKTGTSAATTDDLAEGGNLYFTSGRVYSASKSILQAGAGVTITPDDGDETLTLSAMLNIDGGSASSVYLPSQLIDGGAA